MSIQTMTDRDEFYRAEDLADKLKVNIMTIYRYIKAGKLKAYKIGKEFRINRKEFERFLITPAKQNNKHEPGTNHQQ